MNWTMRQLARRASKNNMIRMFLIMFATLSFGSVANAQQVSDAGVTNVQQPPLTQQAVAGTVQVLAQRLAAAEAALVACQNRCQAGQSPVSFCPGTVNNLTDIRAQISALDARSREALGLARRAIVIGQRAQVTANDALNRARQAQAENDRQNAERLTDRATQDARDDGQDERATTNEATATAALALATSQQGPMQENTRVNGVQTRQIRNANASIRGLNTAVRSIARLIPEGWGMLALSILAPASGDAGRSTTIGGGVQLGTTWYPSQGSWVSLDGLGTAAPFRGTALATFGIGLLGGARAGDSVLIGGGVRLTNMQLTTRVEPSNGMNGYQAGSLGWLVGPSVRVSYAPRSSHFRCGAEVGIGFGESTQVGFVFGCGASFNETAESITAPLREPTPPPPPPPPEE